MSKNFDLIAHCLLCGRKIPIKGKIYMEDLTKYGDLLLVHGDGSSEYIRTTPKFKYPVFIIR